MKWQFWKNLKWSKWYLLDTKLSFRNIQYQVSKEAVKQKTVERLDLKKKQNRTVLNLATSAQNVDVADNGAVFLCLLSEIAEDLFCKAMGTPAVPLSCFATDRYQNWKLKTLT